MRWEELFDDLESQAEATMLELEQEDAAEIEVAEQAQILLADRIRARIGSHLVVGVEGESYAGDVIDASRAWVLLAGPVSDVLVPMSAIAWVDGLERSAPSPQGAELKIGLGHVLRRLAQEEVDVRVLCAGRTVSGVIDRVGYDHLEVRVNGAQIGIVVPFWALTSVAL